MGVLIEPPFATIVAPLPDLEPVVGDLRAHLDRWASRGIGAHVTVLGPVPSAEAEVAVAVAEVAPTLAETTIVFDRAAVSAGAVVLVPADDEPSRRTAAALEARHPSWAGASVDEVAA